MTKLLLTGPTTVGMLFEAYQKAEKDWRRDHLGASMIGHKCDRYLWQSFRWAAKEDLSGQKLRLFERGQREEAWVIRDLERAGATVTRFVEGTRQQRTVRWGHVGGGLDGTVSGLVEAPQTEHVLEIKTHNAKSFERLKEKGVKASKPEHWAQMQVYMLGSGLDRACYIAVCKDTDEIYMERVRLEPEKAEAIVARGHALAAAVEPPAKLDKDQPPCVLTSRDGTRWPCKFFELCHGKQIPERNCRTCCSSTPGAIGDESLPIWSCDRTNKQLSSKKQRTGCKHHRTIPPLINAQVSAGYQGAMHYSFADGTQHLETDLKKEDRQ